MFFYVEDEKTQKVLRKLALKYGIDPDKIALHKYQVGKFLKWVLYRLVCEEEDPLQPLPEQFIMDFERAVVNKQRRKWERHMGDFSFEASPTGITPEQIMANQQAFSAHCALFHVDD